MTTKTNKQIQGTVVSDKMNQTIGVEQTRLVKHPLYGKYIRRKTRIFADNPENQAQKNDVVLVEQCRPLSKKKNWRLVKIIEKA